MKIQKNTIGLIPSLSPNPGVLHSASFRKKRQIHLSVFICKNSNCKYNSHSPFVALLNDVLLFDCHTITELINYSLWLPVSAVVEVVVVVVGVTAAVAYIWLCSHCQTLCGWLNLCIRAAGPVCKSLFVNHLELRAWTEKAATGGLRYNKLPSVEALTLLQLFLERQLHQVNERLM